VLEFSAETQKYIVCHFKESFQLTCKNVKLVLLKGNISVFKETRRLPGTDCREERGTTPLVGGHSSARWKLGQ